MKKILILIIAVFMMTGIFAGCGNKQAAGESAIASTTTQTNTAEVTKKETKFPLTVKDTNGTEMVIESKPSKIVSLTLGTDEMLLSLVDKSSIKALSFLSEDQGLSNILEEAKSFPVKVNTEAEKIISLQPDLIFVADWTDANFVKQLRDSKLVVYAYKTPNGVEEQENTIKEIAHIVGEDAKGEEVVNGMETKLKEIGDKLKSLKEEEKLTAVSCDSYFYAYGKNTTFDSIAKNAGLINLTSKLNLEGWVQISKEKILEMNPDVLFLPSWSYKGFDAKVFAEDIKNDKSLADVKAIKNNRVYALPDAHMTAISQYIVLGVEDAAKAVYPELFK